MTLPIDPHTLEFRATLDVMGMLLAGARVTSVRIATDSPPWAIGAVRRLAVDDYRITVDSEEIQRTVAAVLGIHVGLAEGALADAAFCPFSVDPNWLPPESTIVGAARNALSYRSLRYPGSVRSLAVRTVLSLRRQRSLDGVTDSIRPRSWRSRRLANSRHARSREVDRARRRGDATLHRARTHVAAVLRRGVRGQPMMADLVRPLWPMPSAARTRGSSA